MRIASLLILVLFFACNSATPTKKGPPYPIQKQLVTDNAMVVTAHPLASEVGLEILKAGGNAVDAAIAVNFTLAVVYPRAGNIGGGGFMIVRDKDGKTEALDFREKAPKAAFRDMYLDNNGEVVEGLSRNGTLAVGVPGVVDGMVNAHKKFGKLPWHKLLEPAIKLAVGGFLITEQEADVFNEFQGAFKENNRHQPAIVNDADWQPNDQFIQKELARTLMLIKDKGVAGFYEGPTAKLIIEEMKASNGIITHDDLKSYESVWRTPVFFDYDEYRLVSMPPPSSGGITLAQMLAMVEPYDLKALGFQSSKSVHLMAEAERRAYADRAEHLGDADFYKVPQQKLVAEAYASQRMSNFSPQKAGKSEETVAGKFSESEETTHFSIVDKDGNAVSLTTTLNSNFGSKTVVKGAGFFLNNEMDDFSAKPGVPNQFGLVGNEANAVEPEKRMLSSMTPTIIEKNGELFMVVGTPGGSTIITSVFQVFLNVAEFGLPLKEAVHNKRFHHQWLPDKIFVEENTLSPEVVKELENLGHVVEKRDYIGRVEAILRLPNGKLEGVADDRGDDSASGY